MPETWCYEHFLCLFASSSLIALCTYTQSWRVTCKQYARQVTRLFWKAFWYSPRWFLLLITHFPRLFSTNGSRHGPQCEEPGWQKCRRTRAQSRLRGQCSTTITEKTLITDPLTHFPLRLTHVNDHYFSSCQNGLTADIWIRECKILLTQIN